MSTNLFSSVLAALGIEDRQVADSMTLDIRDTGRLSVEKGNHEILLSLASPLIPADTTTFPKALSLANPTNVLPLPLWVGKYAENLVLITSVDEHVATRDAVIHAVTFLLRVHNHLFS